ncbi:ATPase [Herminiimonas sp. KBW02]|nr:ATPase [Herminiimonas sp. KBW02]
MFICMLLETLGVSLIVPAVALLTEGNIATNYPATKPFLESLGNPTQQQLVVGGMLSLVFIYLIKGVLLAILAWQQNRFAFDLQVRLSQRLFSIYLSQPYTFHLQRNSAQLIRNVSSEVNMLTTYGVLPALILFSETLIMLGLCSLLLLVEPLGAVIAVGVLGMAAWGFHRFTRRHISRWGDARQLHDGLRMQHLMQGLGGVKDVKLLGRETEFLQKYELHNVQGARVAQRQATLQLLPRLWLEVLAVAGLAILVISMLAQGRALDVVLPTLGMFAAAAFRLMPSVNRILASIQSLRYGLSSIETAYSEIKLGAPEVRSVETGARFAKNIELNHISYSYESAAKPAINNVCLKINRGESIGFIGTSGAGKSTLVDIILGLIKPSSGSVDVDGKDIQYGLRNWQDQIGYVPQAIFLTDDTLRRNVAFGVADEEIDEQAVVDAIKDAQLEPFIESLPEGLATMVGERGVRLSGGQRQRIGIARALYHKPSVLVLDEATSALDTPTESEVMRAVRALKDKTVLIVAHRLSTVGHCDRLYRLDGGEVIAAGVPEQMGVGLTNDQIGSPP